MDTEDPQIIERPQVLKRGKNIRSMRKGLLLTILSSISERPVVAGDSTPTNEIVALIVGALVGAGLYIVL